MPYFSDQQNQDDLDKQAAAQAAQLKLSGGQDQGSTGTGANPQRAGVPGSQFSTLEKFFEANKGGEFGTNVGAKVQGDINQATTGVSNAVTGIKDQIGQSGVVASTADIQNQVVNPTEANIAKYNQMINSNYSGPNSLYESDLGKQVQGGLNTAIQTANATQSMAGRENLLDKYYGNPNYTQGMKTMSAALLNRSNTFDPNVFKSQADKLAPQLQTTEKDIANTVAARKAEVDRTRDQARTAIGLDESGNVSGGALGALQSGINKKVQDWNTEQSNKYNALSNAVSSDNFNAQDLAALGLSGGQNLYNLNLGQYLNKGGQADKYSVMTPDDFLRETILEKMAGLTPNFVDPNNAALVGKGPQQAEFNKDQFNADFTSQDNAYKSQSGAIDSEIAKQTAILNDAKSKMNQTDPFSPQNYPYRGAMQAAQKALDAANAQKSELDKQFNIGRAVNATQSKASTQPIDDYFTSYNTKNPKLKGRGEF